MMTYDGSMYYATEKVIKLEDFKVKIKPKSENFKCIENVEFGNFVDFFKSMKSLTGCCLTIDNC